MVRLLTREQTAACALYDLEALACVAGCLTRRSQGRSGDTERLSLRLPLSPSPLVVTANQVDGLPSVALRCEGDESFLQLLDAQTGALQAILLDQGYLQELAASLLHAVATRHLAPGDVEAVGLFEVNPRGLDALRGVALVRDFSRLSIPEVQEVSPELLSFSQEAGFRIETVPDPDQLYSSCEVLLVPAPGVASAPRRGLLRPGALLLTSGTGQAAWASQHHQEFDLVACEAVSSNSLRGRIPRGLLELGRLTSGSHSESNPGERLTLCHLEDLPALDSALGWLAWRKAQKYKLGTQFPA